MMRRFWILTVFVLAVTIIVAVLAPAPRTLAQTTSGGGQLGIANDPCASPTSTKQSVVVNISTATTTEMVASSGAKQIFVCEFAIIYTSGTTPTVAFKTGTKVTNPCDTGAVSLTGTMSVPATVGQGLVVGAGHNTFTSSAGGEICITSAGTNPTVQGFMTFVQQ